MFLGRRKFHNSGAASRPMKNLLKSVSRVWNRAPADALSSQALLASQTLRENLDTKKNIRGGTLDLLSKLKKSTSYPPHIYKLLDRSVESGQLQVDDLVKMFQTVVEGDTAGALNSKLFIKLHKLPKIDTQVHAQNIIMYFQWLLTHQSPTQAIKFIQGTLRSQYFTEAQMLNLIEILTSSGNADGIPKLFEDLATCPSDSIIQAAYLGVCDANAPEALSQLTSNILNPRQLEISRPSLIVILDSHISLGIDGKRVLSVALATSSEEEQLEYLELLLMCVMHFRGEKSVGEGLVKRMKTQALVKETWDLLLQWEIYSSSDIGSVLKTISENGLLVDSATLTGLIKICDIARRSEVDISQVRDYFSTLGIDTDAAGYSILIDRALNAIEIEKARQLFLASVDQGVDWTLDNSRYVSVLSKLLTELCQSATVDDAVKFDTYQRIRMLSTASVSYSAQLEMLKMFLHRDSTSDLAKFLIEQWGETPSLPWAENKEVYTAFMDKMLASTDYREAWELYRIFNTAVSLPYESYLPVQKMFCRLGRPDAAHLMFRHLRNRAKKEGIRPPGREMYLTLFVEYGRWQYEEGVTELDTYFRMDLNNDLDIDIMNSMLLSYSCLSDSPKIRDLWTETNSFAKGKGFNNLTGSILLKHLAPISLEAVDDLWADIPARYGIKPNEDNLCEYVVANCYHGFYSRALEIVKQAPEIYGIGVSPKLISTVYNWTLIDSRKETVKEWATETFPNIWHQLEESNQLKNILINDDPTDSEDHIRYEAIQRLKEQTAGPLMKAVHRTTDED